VMTLPCWEVVLESLRLRLGLVVATGEAGDGGRYDESEAASDGPDELATLPLPFKAAGGRLKPPSSGGALALLLPVMSVEGCGVGGRLGRGIMVRVVLIEEGMSQPVSSSTRGRD
jgi:hypothetical protein